MEVADFYGCAVIVACFGGFVMAGIGIVLFFLLRSRIVPFRMQDNLTARTSWKDLHLILLVSVIPQALITPISFVYQSPSYVPDLLMEAAVLALCALLVCWLWALRHVGRILLSPSRDTIVSWASIPILLSPSACSAITIAGLTLGFIH